MYSDISASNSSAVFGLPPRLPPPGPPRPPLPRTLTLPVLPPPRDNLLAIDSCCLTNKTFESVSEWGPKRQI